jgi:RNA polymerase sigma factor (sigma-70 family)
MEITQAASAAEGAPGAVDDASEPTDEDLLARVRAGQTEAYGVLFARHQHAARAFALRLAGTSDADDLVAEAFAKVLDVVCRNMGPTRSFTSYLFTSIRSIRANTLRDRARYDLTADYAGLSVTQDFPEPHASFDDLVLEGAFRRLPARWKTVLWWTAVEDMPISEAADRLGLNPNAAAALSFRARKGLRRAVRSGRDAQRASNACSRLRSAS